MKITKKEDHYLFENEQGSYHLMINKFNELGKEKAVEFVESELRKKGRKFTGDRINFKIARSLGFCEYGIEDFCERLDLDTEEEYEIHYLKSILTKEIVSEYFNECFKLFGLSVFDKWCGPKEYLKETKDVNNILRPEIIPEIELHKLAVKFAYRCIENFEKEYPEDDRPRKAIEAKEAWIRGDITDEQLRSAAESAAESAWSARSAARSAAESAWSARSAAESAAESAWSARSAARSAAESAEVEWQINEVLKVLEVL